MYLNLRQSLGNAPVAMTGQQLQSLDSIRSRNMCVSIDSIFLRSDQDAFNTMNPLCEHVTLQYLA